MRVLIVKWQQKFKRSWSSQSTSCLECCSRYVKVLTFKKTRIEIWLYENTDYKIQGQILGFDEFMNLVLDDAQEIHLKTLQKKSIGRILLKGDNISLLQSASP